MKIALFYGSTTGNTEDVAERIQRLLGSDQVALFDIADEPLSLVEQYSHVIMGIPTWDYGEVQSEWEDVWDDIDQLDFSGKQVALYGLGDQIGYGEWFVDAMGLLHDKLVAQGASMVGYWPVAGYEFTASKALTGSGEQFVGLAIDEDSQSELTEERVELWVAQLTREFGLDS
ncbi:flavodoxin FldB [Motiliproteus sediminis]|uniref:flavodoxin FldB n=1 Tax=Motiliproteus sediminis TaxID=1468178 RepID=UPI001AF004B9